MDNKRHENIDYLSSVKWDDLSDRSLQEIAERAKHARLKSEEYNPDLDKEVCECGHAYYRHYDSYEDHNDPVGCKYCSCRTFHPVKEGLEVFPDVREYGMEGSREIVVEMLALPALLRATEYLWWSHDKQTEDVVKEAIGFGIMRLDGVFDVRGSSREDMLKMAEDQCKDRGFVFLARDEAIVRAYKNNKGGLTDD